MLPISYCFKNLQRRPGQSLQLILGNTIVIVLIMTAASMNSAMEQTLNNTGDNLNALFLGSGSEESVERSEVKLATNEIIASSVSGIRQIMGKACVSPEVHFNGMLSTASGQSAQALLRGVRYEALWVHDNVRIIKGRFPNSGEIMVGRLAYHKLGIKESELEIGQTLFFNEEKLRVSGIFDAIGTVVEAEVWLPLNDLMTYTQRDNLSCIVAALNDYDAYGELDAFSKRRLDLELIAIRESEYYSKLSIFYAPIRWMAWICAVLLSLGAVFGGLNSLYAAFSSRIREFGAIQAIGFNRFKITLSLVTESSVTALMGSFFAYLIIKGFLQNLAVPFSIGVFVLEFNLYILSLGITTALFLGIIGALPPAWKCLSPSLPETLRSS